VREGADSRTSNLAHHEAIGICPVSTNKRLIF
jgi:hypothetical protein